MIFSLFQKFWFSGIPGPPYCGIGATIRIGREMLCLPYAGFFFQKVLFSCHLGMPGWHLGSWGWTLLVYYLALLPFSIWNLKIRERGSLKHFLSTLPTFYIYMLDAWWTTDQVTEWPSDWVTKWPSDWVIEWSSYQVTKWPSDRK